MPVSLFIGDGGPIPDFNGLKSALLSVLDRPDVTASLPLFIGLCEARLNRLIRAPEMEEQTSWTVTSDTIALPDNFLQVRAVTTTGTPSRTLKAMAPSAVFLEYGGYAGIPLAYTINGLQLKLIPPPCGTIVVNVAYYARIASLSDDIPTNWLLEKAPDLYFYGSLVQANAFIDDPEKTELYKSAFDEAIGELQVDVSNRRWGSGPLVPNGTIQTRGARC